MNITQCVVICGKGSDKIYLHTDLPNPTFPYTGNLSVGFDAAKRTGAAYCSEHFPGISLKIINYPGTDNE